MDESNYAQNFRARLSLFARVEYDKGQNYFEEFCGLSNGTIAASKRNGMSALNLARIAERCPQLNLRWLLLGVGEMTDELAQAKVEVRMPIGNINADNQSQVTMQGQDGEAKAIEALAEECRGLRQQLAAQTEIIRALMKQRK